MAKVAVLTAKPPPPSRKRDFQNQEELINHGRYWLVKHVFQKLGGHVSVLIYAISMKLDEGNIEYRQKAFEEKRELDTIFLASSRLSMHLLNWHCLYCTVPCRVHPCNYLTIDRSEI